MYYIYILLLLVCVAILTSLQLHYRECFENKQNNIHAYVINMDKNKDRYSTFMSTADSYMHDTHVEKFSAIDGTKMSFEELEKVATPEIIDGIKELDATNKRSRDEQLTRGMIGCYMSHISLYKHNLEKHNDIVMVFEDDAKFNIDLVEFIQKLNEFPTDWDILLLGHVGIFEEKPYSKFWNQVYNFWGTHAYVISKSGMQKLVQSAYPISKQIDHKMSELAKSEELKIYAYKTILVSQAASYTTVQMNVTV